MAEAVAVRSVSDLGEMETMWAVPVGVRCGSCVLLPFSAGTGIAGSISGEAVVDAEVGTEEAEAEDEDEDEGVVEEGEEGEVRMLQTWTGCVSSSVSVEKQRAPRPDPRPDNRCTGITCGRTGADENSGLSTMTP